jgi:hypothetical protein
MDSKRIRENIETYAASVATVSSWNGDRNLLLHQANNKRSKWLSLATVLLQLPLAVEYEL